MSFREKPKGHDVGRSTQERTGVDGAASKGGDDRVEAWRNAGGDVSKKIPGEGSSTTDKTVSVNTGRLRMKGAPTRGMGFSKRRVLGQRG